MIEFQSLFWIIFPKSKSVQSFLFYALPIKEKTLKNNCHWVPALWQLERSFLQNALKNICWIREWILLKPSVRLLDHMYPYIPMGKLKSIFSHFARGIQLVGFDFSSIYEYSEYIAIWIYSGLQIQVSAVTVESVIDGRFPHLFVW